jgi:hypothetical protein
MAKNGTLSTDIPGVDPDFLVTQDIPAHSIVERTVTVKSMALPQTRIAEVEMIEITEKVIPLNSAATKSAGK